jgi:alkylhydroperoxidase/carboxymuconolactone decarboxylase family protein YurZ
MKITLLDPALCCSTGVCGPDVDDELVQTAAHVKWLKSLGHDVHRHNISNDGDAFKKYPAAIEHLQKNGMDSLPYILIDDQLVLTGSYPTRDQWERYVSTYSENTPESLEEVWEKKTDILIAIGAAIAASNEDSLVKSVAKAKAVGLEAQEIARAMSIGNDVKNSLGQEIITRANALLNEMQPASSTCAPGSGCC